MNLIVSAGLIILIVAASMGLVVHRIVQRPLSLERFRLQFEEVLSERVKPLRATIGGLALTRVRWSGIEIEGRDIELLSADGHVWVTFTKITLLKPLSAILSPRSLAADGPTGPLLFSGSQVDALQPQAPFHSLYGVATSTDDTLRFAIAGGMWGGATINQGVVTLEGLGTAGIRADVSFICNAAAADALRAASTPPLDLADVSAVDASPLEGTVEADVHLEFAFADLPRVEHRTTAKIRDIRLPNGPADLELTEGRFDVSVANEDITVEGAAHFGGVPTKIRYSKSNDTGSETLRIDSPDIGDIAGALNISGRLHGGRLQITLARGHGDEPWSGPIALHDVRVLQAPLLARLLTMASFPGLLSTLTNDGLTVDSARSEFTFESRIIRCASIRISVDQLEITGSVVVNLGTRLIEGEGLLIPAASLQRLVGAVPVVGSFLEGLGRKDTPIVATRFTLSGPLSYPEITIHPPIGLAPEILKELGRF